MWRSALYIYLISVPRTVNLVLAKWQISCRPITKVKFDPNTIPRVLPGSRIRASSKQSVKCLQISFPHSKKMLRITKAATRTGRGVLRLTRSAEGGRMPSSRHLSGLAAPGTVVETGEHMVDGLLEVRY